jgi:acyl CoA:acetate/3-ketoacid CoA transferase beta subunit
MVTALQDKNRFLPKVSYISSPGQRVRTVVSDLGIYEKQGEELVLTTYFPRPELKGEEAHLRFIRENTGWDLKIAPQVQVEPPPSLDELKLLRLFDPRRQFLGKR